MKKMNDLSVDIFDLSADLFLYPQKQWFSELENLQKITQGIDTPNVTFEELENTYVEYFDINSKNHKTTPYASYWIDGVLNGKASAQIEEFYRICGYKFDLDAPNDHISSMLAFCAILIEDGKKEEFDEFKKWLFWLEDFNTSLKTLPIVTYSQIITNCNKILQEGE